MLHCMQSGGGRVERGHTTTDTNRCNESVMLTELSYYCTVNTFLQGQRASQSKVAMWKQCNYLQMHSAGFSIETE